MITINLLREPRTNEWLANYMEKQAATLIEGARILREIAAQNRVQFDFKRQFVRRPQPTMESSR